LERPRDERRESAGLVLHIADALQVTTDARRDRRCRTSSSPSIEADLVYGSHHVEPFLRVAFRRNTLANFVVEDLAAAARK
jgi:hypothetical protein